MASISFGGLASGLPPNLVDQLVEAEKAPIKTIEKNKGKQENRLKLVSEVEEKLNKIQASIGTLASTKGFSDIKLISGDPNVIQGTIDPNSSVPGSWNVEVVQLANKAAAVTNGFPDKDHTELGVGYFKFETPDGTREVYINGDNNTLEKAAAAINAANVGMRATVINDRKTPDAPYKLMISGEAVGGENRVTYPKLYFLDGDQDLYFDDEREAQNGIVKIDGIEFEIQSNQIKDLIPGVTLDIKQASPGRSVNVTVKENQEVVSGKIKDFVDAVNGVLSFIQSQNRLNEKSDTTQTLGGDSLLRSIEQRLRRLVQGQIFGASDINRLATLGITFNRSGTLDFDQEKFNSTLARNPGGVQAFFAGDGFNTGFIPALKREMRVMLDTTTGPLPIRKRALQDKIAQMDQQIANKQKHIDQKEIMLRNKFAKLEETMSRLKAQGSSLGAIAQGALPTTG